MSELALAPELDQELACVVIPTATETLLLPNVCVAEIVKYKTIKPVDQCPPWLDGMAGWRGQAISVVNFAGFDQTSANARAAAERDGSVARCLVVMNRSKISDAPAFYGILATALPRILQLSAADLKNHNEELGDADAMKVIVGTELATIPDLAFVEQKLKSLHLSQTPA